MKILHPTTIVRPQTETVPKAAYQAGGFYERESDFLTEETFREVLCFERKRSERSGRTLLVMLLDMSGIADEKTKYDLIRRFAQTLTALRQEIHIKGWHKHKMVLGAIFTETQETGKDLLRDTIVKTIAKNLSDEQARSFKLVFQSFPELSDEHSDGQSSSLFYPEPTGAEKTRHYSLFFKRAMDIVGGLAGIVLFSPFFVLIPILIKMTSKGPVLFRQERIGKHCRKFLFFKFRTMAADNDPKIHREYIKNFIREQKSSGHDLRQRKTVYKIKDDPRVTSVGKFLRKTSLDELPQFFNVLKGEMSLVGPRPPIPYELENYDLWHRRRVIEIKPGITGLWQVKGRSTTTFDEMVRLDLQYSKEWSLWLDIKIILKTPWVVIAGKGAY